MILDLRILERSVEPLDKLILLVMHLTFPRLFSTAQEIAEIIHYPESQVKLALVNLIEHKHVKVVNNGQTDVFVILQTERERDIWNASNVVETPLRTASVSAAFLQGKSFKNCSVI